MELAIHVDLNKVLIVKLPQSVKDIIKGRGESILIEIVPAKLCGISEGWRQVNINTLDIKEGIVFLEAVTPNSTSCL